MTRITYNITTAKRETQSIFGYENVQVRESDEVSLYSALGTPIWMPVEIEDISWQSNGKTFSIPGIMLACCIVDISLPRNIVKTELEGRDGTVKEYINNGDYQLTIKGILSNDLYLHSGNSFRRGDMTYPMQAAKHLHAVCTAPVALPVNHPLLTELGIYRIVVEEISLPSSPGKQNIQAFEIKACSDQDYLLTERDGLMIS